MDFSQAKQIEVNAYRQRYNHLAIVAMEKNCETDRKPILEEPENGTKPQETETKIISPTLKKSTDETS